MIGEILQNKYEVIRELGRGGMSVVYLVKDWKLDKFWAMKVLHMTKVNDNEFYLLKRLSHFGLPRIVDFFYINEQVAYIMDYIDGEPLDKLLLKRYIFSYKQVISIGVQLCDILHYLHTQHPPIIYRDMKPSNIILLQNGQVKLIDLSISRLYKCKQTSDTQVLGTKGYCPPEQYGRLQTDVRSDIYALGMTLHHLLTGIDPRRLDYVYQSPRVVNKKITRHISYVVDKCTQIDPKKRYSDCLKVKKALLSKASMFYVKVVYFIGVVSVVCGLLYFYNKDELVKRQQRYDSLVWQQPITQTGENYIQAIHLMPNKIEAYQKLLLTLGEHDFESGEKQLLTLYRLYQNQLDYNQHDVQHFFYDFSRQILAQAVVSQHNFYYHLQQATDFFDKLLLHHVKPNIKEKIACYSFICREYLLYMPIQANLNEMDLGGWENIILRVEYMLENGDVFDKLLFSQLFLNLVFRQKENIIATRGSEKIHHVLYRIQQDTPNYVVTQRLSKPLQQLVLQTVDNMIYILQ